MAERYEFYVRDNRKITFNLTEPIMREDSGVTDFVFYIPKVLNGLEVSDWQWWLVFVNAKKEKYSIALTLSEDPERPLEFNIATYTVDYAMSIKAGSVQFALEAINAGTGGAIDNEWHTYTYETKVKETLQGNQAEYAETESDIISALLEEVRTKMNQVIGGATPTPAQYKAQMTDPNAVYLYVGSEPNEYAGHWYYHNGTTFVSGGVYGAGVTDSAPTQGSSNAVQSGGVYSALQDVRNALDDNVDSIQSEVGYFTEYRPVLMSKGRINIGASTTNLTPVDVEGYEYAIVPCSQGDMFVINAQTESGIRVHGFVASGGTTIATTGASKMVDIVVVAPSGADYLVINNRIEGKVSYIGHKAFGYVDACEKELNYPIKMHQFIDSSGKYQYKNTSVATILFNNFYSSDSPYRYAIVPCAEGDVFTINATGAKYSRAYAFAGIDGTNLGMADAYAELTDYVVTAPANTAFLIINDSSGRTSYKGALGDCLVKRSKLSPIESDISGLQDDVSEIEKGLYNIPISVTGTGGWIYTGIDDTSVAVNTSTAYDSENFDYALVQCQAGDEFVLNIVGGNKPRAYAFLDANNMILERADADTSFANYTVTAPQNAVLLVINDKSHATSYYGGRTVTYRLDVLEQAGNTPLKLAGKKMVNFGDSIFGRGGQGVGGISGRIAYKTGATVYNCGLSGSTYTLRNIASSAGYNPFALCSLADAIASGDFSAQETALSEEQKPDQAPVVTALLEGLDFSAIDYVTIALGTNDFGSSMPLDNENNPKDKTTVCGSLRHSIETLLTAYPKALIVILSTIYRASISGGVWADRGANSLGLTLQDYNDALKGVADEYHLKFIDNFNVGFNRFTASQYYASNDGTHPDIAGFEVLAENISAHL